MRCRVNQHFVVCLPNWACGGPVDIVVVVLVVMSAVAEDCCEAKVSFVMPRVTVFRIPEGGRAEQLGSEAVCGGGAVVE